MKVVDTVIANQEVDFYRLRVAYLTAVVDHFYVGEARFAFSGQPKRLAFADLQTELDREFGEGKCTVLEIPLTRDLLLEKSRWSVEQFSRQWLAKTVSGLEPESAIMLCDLDEVPSTEQVNRIRKKFSNGPRSAYFLPMKNLMRFGNWVQNPRWWLLGSAIVFPGSRQPAALRKASPLRRISGEPGAHMSYIGFSQEELGNKYASFSHQELDQPFLSSDELIDFANKYRINHCGLADRIGFGLLRVEDESSLNSVQSFFLEHAPEWFNFSPFKERVFNRLYASAALTGYVRGDRARLLSSEKGFLASTRFSHGIQALALLAGNQTGLALLLRNTKKLLPHARVFRKLRIGRR